MEYLRVSFDPHDIRDVIAYGNIVGRTQNEQSLPLNYYVISLSGGGYASSHWYGLVSGTSLKQPLRLTFAKA
jgi:hypothetical protein